MMNNGCRHWEGTFHGTTVRYDTSTTGYRLKTFWTLVQMCGEISFGCKDSCACRALRHGRTYQNGTALIAICNAIFLVEMRPK